MRRLILLLLAISLASCAGQQHSQANNAHPTCGAGDVIVLPTIRTKTALFVDVVVNGTPAHFLLDTGAEKTSIRRSFFLRLGLQGGTQKNIDINGFGGTAKGSGTKIREIRAGNLLASDVDVTIMDESKYDGILGLDLLSRYDVDFDVINNRIALHSESLCPGQKPNWGGGEIVELRAGRHLANQMGTQIRNLNLIYITAQLDGQSAVALLDTGNGVGAIVNPGFAEKLGVTAQQLGTVPIVTTHGVLEERNRLWQFKDLLIGHEDFPAPRMLVASTHALPFEINLGFRFFAGHRVWIDFDSNRVFIARATPQAS